MTEDDIHKLIAEYNESIVNVEEKIKAHEATDHEDLSYHQIWNDLKSTLDELKRARQQTVELLEEKQIPLLEPEPEVQADLGIPYGVEPEVVPFEPEPEEETPEIEPEPEVEPEIVLPVQEPEGESPEEISEPEPEVEPEPPPIEVQESKEEQLVQAEELPEVPKELTLDEKLAKVNLEQREAELWNARHADRHKYRRKGGKSPH